MKTVVALALFFACVGASAHRDRWLTLRPDGSIPELPAQFDSARMHVSYLGGSPPGVVDLTFESGGKRTVVPRCLLNLIQPISPNDVKLSGSWYHNEALLPYYVNVHFKGNMNLAQPVGTEFLFSLRDASLLEVTRLTGLRDSQGVQRTTVVLKDGCPS